MATLANRINLVFDDTTIVVISKFCRTARQKWQWQNRPRQRHVVLGGNLAEAKYRATGRALPMRSCMKNIASHD
ncbi:MAG: hypothetical protein HHJ12_05180 [Glaciimonas sp.]|nr:hypothetical protein [Glaciimonas sp.]